MVTGFESSLILSLLLLSLGMVAPIPPTPMLPLDVAAIATFPVAVVVAETAIGPAGKVDGPLAVTDVVVVMPLLHNTNDILWAIFVTPVTRQCPLL